MCWFISRVCIRLCISPFIWWCMVLLIRLFTVTATNQMSCFQRAIAFFFLCGHSSVLSSVFWSFPTLLLVYHTSYFPSLAKFWSLKFKTYLRAASIPRAISKLIRFQTVIFSGYLRRLCHTRFCHVALSLKWYRNYSSRINVSNPLQSSIPSRLFS